MHVTGGSNRSAKDRAKAYRRAMRGLGLEPREIAGTFTHEAGQQAAHEIAAMRPLPTAVVAANDLIAVGAMGVFASLGLRVPEDLSVIGYDDSQIAQLDLVQLTSVRQPVDRFGAAAVSLLVDRIEDRDAERQVQRLGDGPGRSGGRPAGRQRAPPAPPDPCLLTPAGPASPTSPASPG